MVLHHYLTAPQAKKGLFPKILVNDVRNIPIPQVSKKTQQEFIAHADVMLTKNMELNYLRIKFLALIKSKFKIESPSKKIQNWVELDFSEFVGELAKQKIKITAPDEYEFMQLFETEKAKANELKEILTNTDREIDKMVFELYEINEREIDIVETPWKTNK